MWEYCNLNPHSLRVGDCVVRAISKALNQSWGTTYVELSIQGYIMGDIMNSNAVWDRYLHKKGYTRATISNDCADCYSVKDFAKDHAKGTYIVGTGTHATTIINGKIYDIWDCSNEQPIYFYQKENKR